MTKTLLKQKWELVLKYLEETIDPSLLGTLFEPLKPSTISEEDSVLFLGAADNSGFYQNTINHHKKEIEDATAAVFGKPLSLKVVDIETKKNTENEEIQKEDVLDPRYTFASFVSGPSNNMAYAAAQAVADGFSKTYNPLFIYAGSGLGKTHLMHAICHYVRTNKPRKKVLYVSSETFISELSEAIRLKKTAEFKERYRKVDYLLLDDVQFIAGNKFAEEELFNTFNLLFENNKQMVFTSDRAPKDIDNFPERLYSRFVWGLMVDIQKPDYQTRMAILKNKAILEHIEETPALIEVFDFIARKIKDNIRELEGAFNRVLAFSSISNSELNLKLAKKILYDIDDSSKNDLNPDIIKKAVADYYGIKVSDLDSSKRSKNIAFPRHVAIYLIRDCLDMSYPAIAKLFGKDHTSIMHSCNVIENSLDKDEALKAALRSIRNNL